MARRPRKPAYTLHKPTGQARVRIGSTDHYLGAYGSPESYERYEQLLGGIYLNQGVEPSRMTVGGRVRVQPTHRERVAGFC